jgi:hypothetical protein
MQVRPIILEVRMKKFILVMAALASIFSSGMVPVFAEWHPGGPDLGPTKERRLEEGGKAKIRGYVVDVDRRRGSFLLRRRDGGTIVLQAAPDEIARLHRGEEIRAALRRSPEGIDYVVGIQVLRD